MRFISSVLPVLLLAACSIFGQAPPAPQKADNIQDNSFLLEEAYNQEPAVIQHINFFIRRAQSHDWYYSFTQEWPINGQKNQFSYTVQAVDAGRQAPGAGPGVGDTLLKYRYQLVGSGETRVAVTPRFSLILPSGNSVDSRGFGAVGFQNNNAASIVLMRKLVTHINAGATWVPHAKDVSGAQASVAAFNLGESFIWLANPRFNVMVETVYTQFQSIVADGKTEWERDLLISPGVRWAYNFKNGLQIVPGVAFPIGAGPTAGEKGVILYLSFEHPWERLLGWQNRN